MKVSIANDHGALDLKESLKAYLEKEGYEIVDEGCFTKDSCDYPDFAKKAAQDVANGTCERGIVLCTTGIGVSITANKVKGIRCAYLVNEECAKLTRLHNDANMMALGAIVVDDATAKKIADVFLTTPFSGEERHARRISKIEG